MEEQIRKTAQKYYPAENIRSVKIAGNRIIAEISGIAEDAGKTAELKKELQNAYADYKISVIFTEEKNAGQSISAVEKWHIPGVKKIIGVASGKGGVGKSTVAVNLAAALAEKGLRAGLADADIYGPSAPTMLGYEGEPMTSSDGKTFDPFEKYGIQSVSIGSLVKPGTPLIWRGAKAAGALEQLMTQTAWKDVDVLVTDMPPGTGDIIITLAQRIEFAGVIIVSTPQDIALIDAVRGINMFKKTGTPVSGIVENMSYFVCPHCGERSYIFGNGGAAKTAAELKVPFLEEIPLDPAVREMSDKGTPVTVSSPESPCAAAYISIADKIIKSTGL